MIRARVIYDKNRIDRVDEDLQRRARAKVTAAAHRASSTGNSIAGDIGHFEPTPARGTHEGYAAGVRGNWLANVFDAGSLGRRVRPLKRDRRKQSWTVDRRSSQSYVATRHPEALSGDTGVHARNIFAPMRRAGRQVLKTFRRR